MKVAGNHHIDLLGMIRQTYFEVCSELAGSKIAITMITEYQLEITAMGKCGLK